MTLKKNATKFKKFLKMNFKFSIVNLFKLNKIFQSSSNYATNLKKFNQIKFRRFCPTLTC